MEELNPRLTFETFVVGAANRLAVTAARKVGESPGTAYNPLFVYGGSGLGKTHLLMAIGHLARELRADIDLEYVTLNEFVELYQAAVAAGQTDALRSRLARADVLLVDDVHFLARRHELQAELLRVVEQLQSASRQIVLTSDRPPTEIQDLDDRLISRFDGGLVVDIDTPEFETRLAILRRGVADREVGVEADVLEVIAGTQVQSVRELLGLLNRVIAFQAVSEMPLPTNSQHSSQVSATRCKSRSMSGGTVCRKPSASGPARGIERIGSIDSSDRRFPPGSSGRSASTNETSTGFEGFSGRWHAWIRNGSRNPSSSTRTG
jgi:chromosomal replication initiator protein